jgi:hypothetical protein
MTIAFCEWCGEPFPAEEGTYLGCCRKCRKPALRKERRSLWWAAWKVRNLHNLLTASSLTVFFWRTPALDFITIGVAITTVIHLALFTMEMAER